MALGGVKMDGFKSAGCWKDQIILKLQKLIIFEFFKGFLGFFVKILLKFEDFWGFCWIFNLKLKIFGAF